MSDQTDDKTLLPELLPAPGPLAGGTPRERVAERARLLLERFRGLKVSAGAALLSLQCTGYGVVDPLPPPAAQCSELPDPLMQIEAMAFLGETQVGAPNLVNLVLTTRYYPMHSGYTIGAVTVSGGMLVGVADAALSRVGAGSRFEITIAPATTTSVLLIDVALGCGPVTGTKHYRITSREPGSNSNLLVEEIGAAVDGGADR